MLLWEKIAPSSYKDYLASKYENKPGEAIKFYMNGGSHRINPILRGHSQSEWSNEYPALSKSEPQDPDLEALAVIKELDRVMSSSSISLGKYYRFVDLGSRSVNLPKEDDVFYDPGFWSTSKDTVNIDGFLAGRKAAPRTDHRTIILTVTVPGRSDGKAIHGIDVENFKEHDPSHFVSFAHQKEVILPAGSKVKITSVKKDPKQNELYYMEATLVFE